MAWSRAAGAAALLLCRCSVVGAAVPTTSEACDSAAGVGSASDEVGQNGANSLLQKAQHRTGSVVINDQEAMRGPPPAEAPCVYHGKSISSTLTGTLYSDDGRLNMTIAAGETTLAAGYVCKARCVHFPQGFVVASAGTFTPDDGTIPVGGISAGAELRTAGTLCPEVFRRDASPRSMDTSSATSPMAEACSGVVAQGKCWYLSELGESCRQTCAKNNRSVSFVVADSSKPVITKLLGHEPISKGNPWAVLECYSPDSDYYRPANKQAAKYYVGNAADWSFSTCQLSCPCSNNASECSWKPPPSCASSFEYNGKLYEGCIVTEDREKPWCMNFQKKRELGVFSSLEWSSCVYSCAQAAKEETECKWNLPSTCVKEFDYQGAHYRGCTSVNHGTPWCSTSTQYAGSWDHCVYSCPTENDTTAAKLNAASAEDDVLCNWQAPPECAPVFQYLGVDYEGCAVFVDHPTPWCSHDRIHTGAWSLCESVCRSPSGGVVAQPIEKPQAAAPDTSDWATTSLVPGGNRTTPSPTEDPCTRHPDAENDLIGLNAPMDEGGYQVAVASHSSVNMKRFVCRVIDSLGCKATDLSSLMGFLPFFNGVNGKQTYGKLRTELESLCHAGGKWVVTK